MDWQYANVDRILVFGRHPPIVGTHHIQESQ
jgi:hypothetical protein